MQLGGANIQARNTENGWVPMHEAANHGHKEVIKELLSLNAPVNPRTNNNNLPSDLARINGYLDSVQILGKINSSKKKKNLNCKCLFRKL